MQAYWSKIPFHLLVHALLFLNYISRAVCHCTSWFLWIFPYHQKSIVCGVYHPFLSKGITSVTSRITMWLKWCVTHRQLSLQLHISRTLMHDTLFVFRYCAVLTALWSNFLYQQMHNSMILYNIKHIQFKKCQIHWMKKAIVRQWLHYYKHFILFIKTQRPTSLSLTVH